MATKEKRVLISGALVFKKAKNGRTYWFLTKQGEDPDWQVPKVTVRKVESSVRGAMRLMGESGGMNIQVLEEAGRFGGTTTVNGQVLPKSTIYYLAKYLGASEVLGFEEAAWFEYPNALKNLRTKSEKEMLKSSKKLLKTHREKKKDEEELEF